MNTNHYNPDKWKRMKIHELERKKRIFNDKFRIIGVDKFALENQIQDKLMQQQKERRMDDEYKRDLNYYNEMAIQQEQLLVNEASKQLANLRQSENFVLAKEQFLRNKRINDDAFSNIPTDDYYNYFNANSR